MSKKIIAIAGLGWLGLPLANFLDMAGYKLRGSVTSLKKAKTIQQSGVDAYVMQLNETEVTGSPRALLKDVDYLVIAIPPGLRRNSGVNHVLKMSHFLAEIISAKIKKVILVSSTAVYDDSQGEITDKDEPRPETEAAKQLVAVEKLFANVPQLKTTIVRFGGLVGGSRQPVRYLAGRKELQGGLAPVNLIERGDCIRVISEIIRQDAFGHIFNAVHPQHPTKQAYYTLKAKELGLEAPQFRKTEDDAVFKKVDSIYLDLVLNFKFENALI
jgi:nucleoside-diphosphate-sugar epimerase